MVLKNKILVCARDRRLGVVAKVFCICHWLKKIHVYNLKCFVFGVAMQIRGVERGRQCGIRYVIVFLHNNSFLSKCLRTSATVVLFLQSRDPTFVLLGGKEGLEASF